MNLDFSEEQEEFRSELRAFLEERLPDDWVGIFHGPDDYLDLSFAITGEMAERGWLTQTWPEEYGGQSASNWRQVVLQEETWAYFEPRGGQYMGVNWIGPAIIKFGTDEQRMQYLPRIAAGGVQWAQLFSEPGAGSDLAALRTKATPTGEKFVVNGEKIWTSYGDYAEFGVLLARCEPSSERHAGLVVLLVDMATPGIEVKPISTPLGKHKLNSVVFTDVEIPASAVLGSTGDGWRVAMASLAFERVGVARYARSTRILGELERLPEASRPDIERDLATALASARVAELMSYLVVDMKERGEVPTWQGSAARVHNVTLEQRVSSIAERVLGPLALVDSHDPSAVEGGEIEDFVRLAPTGTVTAGAYEIQMGIIAQRGLGLERIR